MNYNAAIIAQAQKHVGEKETAGRASNPVIEAHFARAGFPGMTDEVPWCAAFVGSVLAECGLKPSGSLMARSYMTYGRKVSQQDAQIGDIGVIPRGNPPSGHVFFIAGFEGSNVLALGGNQGDAVTIKPIPLASLIAIRRADPAPDSNGLPTLRFGDIGPDVFALKAALVRLGYAVGKPETPEEAEFGKQVRAAVLKLQANNGLETDAIVGPETWNVIQKAKPEPKRDVTAADLRKRGSETVKAADATSAATGLAAAGVTLEGVRGALSTVQDGQGTLEWLGAFARDNWPLLLIGGALLAIWVMKDRIIAARVQAAVTGENLSK